MKLELGPAWVAVVPRRFRRADLGVRLDIDPTRFAPPNAREEVVGRSTLVIAGGWEVDCLETRVTLPGGEIEHQIRARYHMLDTMSVVVVAGPPDRIAEHRAELDAIVHSATLETTTSACLAHLLADVDG